MFIARITAIGLITGLNFLGCWAAAHAQGRGCQFLRVTGLNFGTYDPFSPVPLDTTGQVQLICRGRNRPVTIQLSQGGSNSFTPRQMSNGSDRLNYNLYLDANRSLIWGDGTEGTQQQGPFIPGNNVLNTLTIYGRIPAQQWVTPGLYTDSLRLTIIF